MNEARDLLQTLRHARLEFEIRQDQIDTQSDHHLGHHGIIRVAKEGFDFQVLLDPFKEQLDLPTLFANLSDGFGGLTAKYG